jgi:hypothetical protein
MPPIAVSRVVVRTFTVWVRTLPQLLVVAAIVHAPLVAVKYLLRDSAEADDWRGAIARALPIVEAHTALTIAEACVVLLVFRRLRGETIDLGRSIAVGLHRIGTVLGIAAILIAPSVLGALCDRLQLSFLRSAADFVFAVVELVIALVFCVPTPVALVERRAVAASFGRSEELTRRSRGRIFGIYVVFGLAIAVLAFVAKALDPGLRGLAWFLVDSLFDVLFTSFFCVLPIVLYHELREAKEGIGLEEIAAVFD